MFSIKGWILIFFEKHSLSAKIKISSKFQRLNEETEYFSSFSNFPEFKKIAIKNSPSPLKKCKWMQ